MKRFHRAVPATLTLVAALTAHEASASEPATRLAVARFHGAHADRLQEALEASLLKRYYVVPDFTVEETARRRGVALVRDDDFAQVGRALRVRGFISAEVRRKGVWLVQMVVRRGDTGEPVARFRVSDCRLDWLEATIAERAPRRLAALLSDQPDATVTDAPATEPRPLPPDAAETKGVPEESLTARPARDVLALRLGARLFNRSFSYAQNLSGLPDYRLQGAVASVLEAALYPFSMPALAPLGLSAALEYGLGIRSHSADGGLDRSSDVHAYALDVRWRFGDPDLAVAPGLGYAVQAFTTGSPGATAPDVSYRLATAGVDARWSPTRRVSLTARAAYLQVLSAGPIASADRFFRASVHGGTGEIGLAVALVETLELYASGGVRRFGFAMNSQPGDHLVAGGAIDQTTWLALGLCYRPAPAAKP